MKQNAFQALVCWRDRPAGGVAPEDRAALLIRAALVSGALGRELDEAQLARIERGLLLPRRRLRRSPLLFRLALAGLLCAAGVATVMAYQIARRRLGLVHLAPTVLPRPRPPMRERVAGRDLPVDAGTAPSPLLEGANAGSGLSRDASVPGSARSRRPPRIMRRAPTDTRPPSAQAAPSEEVLALDRALALLRRQHDAAAALRALDDYLDRFPDGQLAREARFARVDALLMLNRSDQALAALEALPLDNLRRSTELRLIRGELRARSDCARAEQDFDAVLAREPADALEERALYGRGACRIKRGNIQGAARDLRRYLDRFPTGPHAGWARQWLGSTGHSYAKGG